MGNDDEPLDLNESFSFALISAPNLDLETLGFYRQTTGLGLECGDPGITLL